MAEVNHANIPSLVEDYLLVEKDKTPETTVKAAEEAYVETPVEAVPEEAVDKTEAAPLVVENSDVPDASSEANKESVDATGGESTEHAVAAEPANHNNDDVSEEASESAQNDSSADEEAIDDTPEIKLETAPADFRFPTTNQSRHCFTRYIEYHRCIGVKGDDAFECQKFAKYYRALCPGEWVDRWNEQRENGNFPGPL